MISTLFEDIAPARAMGIQVNGFENGRIELVAPIGLNINDKGTAFAGSIASLLTLAGWGAITLRLKEAGVEADVMVVKSETSYPSAARSALFAEAAVSEAERARVFQELEESGRSRIEVKSALHSDGIECAAMTASFAIIAR